MYLKMVSVTCAGMRLDEESESLPVDVQRQQAGIETE